MALFLLLIPYCLLAAITSKELYGVIHKFTGQDSSGRVQRAAQYLVLQTLPSVFCILYGRLMSRSSTELKEGSLTAQLWPPLTTRDWDVEHTPSGAVTDSEYIVRQK